MAPGNKGCGDSDATGKHLVPSFVHCDRTWILSKHVAYQRLWIFGGRGAEARGSAPWTRVDDARRVVWCPVGRSTRVNVTATLSNSGIRRGTLTDCEMFAVTDNYVWLLPDSSVCRVSDDDSGYGDDLVNTGRIAILPGVPEFGLPLLCPNVSRAVTVNRGFLRVDAGGGRFETKKYPGAHPLRRTRAKKLYQLVCFRIFASFRTESLKLCENPI